MVKTIKMRTLILAEEQIKRIISEELGIAKEVTIMANKIYDEIGKLYVRGVNEKVFQLKTEKSDVTVDYISKVFNKSEDYYQWYYDNKRPDGYSYEKNTIFLTFVSIKGVEPNSDMYDTIQHECEHYWECKNKGGAISTDRYQNIIKGIKNNNLIVQYFCKVMYYCNKHEINAFVNGAYASAMKKEKKYESYKDFILDNNVNDLYFTLKNFQKHLLKYDINSSYFGQAMIYLNNNGIFSMGKDINNGIEKLRKQVRKYYTYFIKQIGKVYSLYCIKMKELDDTETRFRANEILRKPFGDREELK